MSRKLKMIKMGRRMYSITLKAKIGNMTLEHFKLDF